MPITLREVTTKKELLQFIKFPFKLYKGNPFYVTPIIDFELSTLLKDKNPAFDHCEACYWVAEKDGEIVGRIAALTHGTEYKEEKLVRFGWVDFIDDLEVSMALFSEAENWAASKGAVGVHGPLGFTDLDFEGALVSGFEKLATQATIYNYPYYAKHFEQLGYRKAVEWVELRGEIPPAVPERLVRGAQLASDRYGLSLKKFNKAKEIKEYAKDIFRVLNESYKHLYGYHPLTEKQVVYYTEQYFGFVRKEFISVVVDREDKVVGTAVTLPSLSKAFQKAKGSLYPFGFIHVLRAFYFNDYLDLFLIGVDPRYKNQGANALIFNDLIATCIKKGVKRFGTGPMLEDNNGVLNLWGDLNMEEISIRRRCFIKDL